MAHFRFIGLSFASPVVPIHPVYWVHPVKKLVSTGCTGSTGNHALRAQRLCESINKSGFALFIRLRRRFAPRNDGISICALSTTNRGSLQIVALSPQTQAGSLCYS